MRKSHSEDDYEALFDNPEGKPQATEIGQPADVFASSNEQIGGRRRQPDRLNDILKAERRLAAWNRTNPLKLWD